MQKKNRQKAQIITVLTPIDIFGAFEEAGDIVLQHSEGLVELFEDPDDRVVLLNILLRLSHRYLRVEASEWGINNLHLYLFGSLWWTLNQWCQWRITHHKMSEKERILTRLWLPSHCPLNEITYVQSSKWPQKNMVWRRWSPNPSLLWFGKYRHSGSFVATQVSKSFGAAAGYSQADRETQRQQGKREC